MKKGLLIVLALLLAATFVIFGVSIGATLAEKTIFLSDTLSGWIAAGSTLAIAVLTLFLALETYELRKTTQSQINDIRTSAIKPEIDVFIAASDVDINLWNVHVKNFGAGVTKRIKIDVEPSAGVMKSELCSTVIENLTRPAFVSNGIAALGPGREIRTYVLNFIELGKDESIHDIRLDVVAKCVDAEGTEHEFPTMIDLRDIEGMGGLGGNPLHRIANAAEAILKKGRENQQANTL